MHKIITDVVDSGFRIALDPLFPPPNFEKRMSAQIPLTLYELCYDSKIDGPEMEKAAVDRPFGRAAATGTEVNAPGRIVASV